jgi:predicted lipid-binding transport protein (Tim44 family)
METRFFALPQTFLGRVAGGLLAAALFVLAFFFLFFFLLAAGVLILGVSLRALWRGRQVRAQTSQDVIEGEYSVDMSDATRLDEPDAETTNRR